MFVLQIFLAFEFLHERRFFPVVFQNLVAADVDERRIGKERYRFGQNVFEKLKRRVGRAKNFLENSPRRLHFVLIIFLAAEFRVSRQSSRRMSGKLDFGNDGDFSRSGISHDIFDLLLRVKTLDRNFIADVRIQVSLDDGFRSARADFGQSLVFFDFDALALIVGQMPVKTVEFILRHQIDVFFDQFDRKEMPRDIEMHSAIRKARFVNDANGGNARGFFEI